MDPDQVTTEFIELSNWAMLIERGLEPAVAMRVTKQYTAKCAEIGRLRAALVAALAHEKQSAEYRCGSH